MEYTHNTIVNFASDSFTDVKPNFIEEYLLAGILLFSNKQKRLHLLSDNYGYIKIRLTYSGSGVNSYVAFGTSNNSSFSISEGGIDDIFADVTDGNPNLYSFELTKDVPKEFTILLNTTSETTDILNILLSVGDRLTGASEDNQILIEYMCDLTPLYKYTAGFHVYSPYDAAVDAKLTTDLYSRHEISDWSKGSKVWANSKFTVPALEYYYAINDRVYKIGGELNRGYGTKTSYLAKQSPWNALWGKKPKIEEEVEGPKDFTNHTEDTTPACVQVFRSKPGIITEIQTKSDVILRIPTRYKYLVGYNPTSPYEANDSVFTIWHFENERFYPLTGELHMYQKLIQGLILAIERDGNITDFAYNKNIISTWDWVQLGAIAAGALLSLLAEMFNFKIDLGDYYDKYKGPNDPWGWIAYILSEGSKLLPPPLNLIAPIAGFLLKLLLNKKVLIIEPCLNFLHYYTETPYIEVGKSLSRAKKLTDTQDLATIHEGYFSDGAYFYKQENGVVVSKELSSANTLINQDPIRREWRSSLPADDPTHVTETNKLLFLPYLSGNPIDYDNTQWFVNQLISTEIILSSCGMMVRNNNSEHVVTIPEGHVVSFISQEDADTKALELLEDVQRVAEANYLVEKPLDDTELGVLNTHFTHTLRIENIPESIKIYFDNSDYTGLTINKNVFYDELGKISVLDGYYAVDGGNYYRTFYKISDGKLIDIFYMDVATQTILTGYYTQNSLNLNNTDLQYQSNWYISGTTYQHIESICNNYNQNECFDSNLLKDENQITRGVYDESTDDLLLYDSNDNLIEPDEGVYLPFIDWLSEGDHEFIIYKAPKTITINIEEICYETNPKTNQLYGFWVVGENSDGLKIPLLNEIDLTIDVHVEPSTVYTYNVTTKSTTNTYVSYDGLVGTDDVVSNIEIVSIDTPTPIGNYDYIIGTFTNCDNIPDPSATPTPTLTPTPTITPTLPPTPTPTQTLTPTPTPDCYFEASFEEVGVYSTIEYGLLYNWYAATDSRNIANEGWHLPTVDDFYDLLIQLDPDRVDDVGENIAGGKLKSIDTIYWNDPNTGATNEVGFNARGTGVRHDTIGYIGLKDFTIFWNYESRNTTNAYYSSLNYDSDIFITKADSPSSTMIPYLPKKGGISIRLLKDSTTLSHGETGTYTGNDGKVYRTICIGTQEWLADNLAETQYRNGDTIPEVTDNTTWGGLTTGALCAYDNDWTYVGIPKPNYY
ncbi:MAG: FISUMP domain-containing protein [bacterium]